MYFLYVFKVIWLHSRWSLSSVFLLHLNPLLHPLTPTHYMTFIYCSFLQTVSILLVVTPLKNYPQFLPANIYYKKFLLEGSGLMSPFIAHDGIGKIRIWFGSWVGNHLQLSVQEYNDHSMPERSITFCSILPFSSHIFFKTPYLGYFMSLELLMQTSKLGMRIFDISELHR